jgi:methylenetetrahydrofolate reductase (NADPH)
MKVTEHYESATQPLISFEIIPPKRGSSVNQVFEALDMVSKYAPPFIDITAHAAEAYYEELKDGTVKRHIKRKRPGTIGLSAAIKHRYNVDPVPHIICQGFTKEETEDALIELNFLGIDNVLAVRGDATDTPKVTNAYREKNEYAVDLVRQIQDMNKGEYLEHMADAQPTDFCVGVGGYPEKHIEAPNLSWDIDRLKEKVDAGADYIVTQMFFDNQHFFDFVDKCRKAGIKVPIVPGIKVLNNTRQLTALPKFFHLNIPEELSASVMNDPKNVGELGIEWAQKQCKELLEHDVCGLHFYIMSNPTSAIRVIDKLGLI